MEWLKANGFFLTLLIGGTAAVLALKGLDFVLQAFLVVLGLGFVIFIHELGHFLAAKWCDVHVKTFSLGFGPAFPGCSFRRGETMYKIAMIPLGGYVSMVGEGTEEGEDEDYPRSFKNKTVGQRMVIISAGVVMNILFGCLAFIGVYRYAGVESPVGVVAAVEPASPAWQKGVRSGSTIEQVGHVHNPSFDNLRQTVAISRKGATIPFVFMPRPGEGERLETGLEPRRDANDQVPVIGVSSSSRLQLIAAKHSKDREVPVLYSSPAADARVIPLHPGDVVLKATDPSRNNELTELTHDLKARTFDVVELCQRLRKLGRAALVLEVSRAGAAAGAPPEKLTLPADGFEFDDAIVGTTDPDTPNEPWRVKPLPLDPTDSSKQSYDYFAFQARMRQLAGKPVVIQVSRSKAAPGAAPESILVPPAFHLTFGARMNMGEVAGVRDNSPAAAAGVRPGDVLSSVVMIHEDKTERVFTDAEDPVRLPFELAREAAKTPGRKMVRLTVLRPNPTTHKADEKLPLDPVAWDGSWDANVEEPRYPSSPMSIPQLGLAYRVDSTVVEVAENSPAAKAGLKANDTVEEIRFREAGKKRDEELTWGRWFKLEATRENDRKAFDEWAHVAWVLQVASYPQVQVRVRRGGDLLEEPLEMTAVPDDTWPLADRGLELAMDTRLQKADSLSEALVLGVDKTYSSVMTIYAFLQRMIERRIPANSVGGPILIAQQAFVHAGMDFSSFVLFLAMISVNLAVVNFLPIPILDGGHMVFLIYEKLRGRPPSEAVRTGATYVGLALLLSLMVFVFYTDIRRFWFRG
jgi:regulator of sigma E protease